jgi:hypothetical protein
LALAGQVTAEQLRVVTATTPCFQRSLLPLVAVAVPLLHLHRHTTMVALAVLVAVLPHLELLVVARQALCRVMRVALVLFLLHLSTVLVVAVVLVR